MAIQKQILSKMPIVCWMMGGVLCCGALFWPSFLKVPPVYFSMNQWLQATVGDGKSFWPASFVNFYAQWQTLLRADHENSHLRNQNEILKMQLAKLNFQQQAVRTQQWTRQEEEYLQQMTGHVAGVTVQAVNRFLSVKELQSLKLIERYYLGVYYFRNRSFEKAAALLSEFLSVSQKMTVPFEVSKNLLMTAIAWYQLKNWILAQQYLDRILQLPENQVYVRDQAQARLWQALLAKQQKQESKVNQWLKELFEHHPYSQETAWISL